MRKRRVISKSKMYGFNPWVDQIDAIDQIMRETGETTESVVLRKLVDEALAARSKKSQSLPLIEESDNALEGRVQTIENLLMRVIRQGNVALRIHDVCLALLQDVLAEAHATHKISWEFVAVPRLRDEGVGVSEIEQRFMLQSDLAKDYAYGRAEEIKESQKPESDVAGRRE